MRDDLKITKAKCPKCKEMIAVTVHGTIARHRLSPEPGEVLGPWCAGSFK